MNPYRAELKERRGKKLRRDLELVLNNEEMAPLLKRFEEYCAAVDRGDYDEDESPSAYEEWDVDTEIARRIMDQDDEL